MCFTNLFSPPISFNWVKLTCATIAPNFPLAAEIPCAVDRYLVGKISPGIMNVVVFGPKFWKKFTKQNRNTKTFFASSVEERLSYANPMIKKRRVRIMKPMS